MLELKDISLFSSLPSLARGGKNRPRKKNPKVLEGQQELTLSGNYYVRYCAKSFAFITLILKQLKLRNGKIKWQINLFNLNIGRRYTGMADHFFLQG